MCVRLSLIILRADSRKCKRWLVKAKVDCLPAPFLYPYKTKNISARQITGFASRTNLASFASAHSSRFPLPLGVAPTPNELDIDWEAV